MSRKANSRPHQAARHEADQPTATPMPAKLTQQSPQKEPLPDVIRQRAYQKWEEAGRPVGTGERFWLEAEQEVRGMTGERV